MEEVVALYTRLRAPDCAEAQEITNALIEFYQTPDSLGVLFQIIFTYNEEYIRKSAIIGIGSFIRSCWKELPEKGEAFMMLLQLSVFEGSSEVRRLNVQNIQTTISEEVVPVIISFAETIAQNLTIINAGAICTLANLTLLYGAEIPAEEEARNVCLQDGVPHEAKYKAISLLFQKYNMLEEPTEESVEFFAAAIEFYKEIAAANEKDLVADMTRECFIFAIGNESTYINYEELLKAALEIMQTSEISYEIRSRAHSLCNNIIDSQKEAVLEGDFTQESLAFNLYAIYVKYDIENGIPEELYTPANDNLCIISSTLSVKEDFLQYVWEVSTSIEDENTLFTVLETIVNTFENSSAFYADKIEQLIQLYLSALENENIGIISLVVYSFKILSEYLGNEITPYLETIIGALIQTISQVDDPSFVPDIFDSIQILILNYSDTDPIFDGVAGAIFDVLNAGAYNQYVLECLATLIKNSEEKSAEHYEQILQLLFDILNSEEEETNYIKPYSIKCISLLACKNSAAFEETAKEFADLIIPTIENEDFAYESTKAYGRLVKTYPEMFNEYSDALLPQFFAICKSDLQPEEDINTEFMGDDDQEKDAQYNRMLNNASASIRIACIILNSYPDKIAACEEDLFASFENMGTLIMVPEVMTNLCESMVMFAESLSKIGEPKDHAEEGQKLIEIVASALETLSLLDKEATGKVFEVIAETMSYFTVATLFANGEIAEQVLDNVYSTLEMQEEEYVEDLYMNASRVLREILDQMHGDAFQYLERFLPLYEGCLQNDDTDFQDLALQFYGEFIALCSDHVDAGFVGAIIELAVKAANERNNSLGFSALKQIACSIPAALESSIETILQLVAEKLDPSIPKTDDIMSLQDSAVSLLGKIAINILGDNFNIPQFLPLLLPAMPAQMDVEENPDIIEFFLWLIEKTNGQYVVEMCSVLARVFSDSREDLLNWYFTEEMLESLHTVFVQYIQGVGDINEFIASIANGDEAKEQNIRQSLE